MTTLRPLVSGIIGAGLMGEVHAHAVRAAGGTVGAVLGSSPAGTDAARRRLGASRAASSVDEILEDQSIDVVHICTPNSTHFDLATRALHAGKPVICEKPLTTNLSEAQTLVELASATAVVNAVPFIYRFYPTVRDAQRRIATNETGRLTVLHGSYLQDWLADPADSNWRVDPDAGGSSRAFGDIGIHWCDLMEFVTGHRIRRLQAHLLTAHPTRDDVAVRTEDAAAILFETDQGALGSVVVSQVAPGRKNRLQFSFDGTEAAVGFDQENPDTLWIGQRSANQIVFRGEETDDGVARYSRLPPGHPQGYQDCFNAFVSDFFGVVDGQEVVGLPTFVDGHRSASLITAVIESNQTKTWVEVPA